MSADSGGTLGGQQFSGSGLAGNINIAAGDQIQMTSGSVSTRAITSDGGNIALNALRMIQLYGLADHDLGGMRLWRWRQH